MNPDKVYLVFYETYEKGLVGVYKDRSTAEAVRKAFELAGTVGDYVVQEYEIQ
jgi:hypothetical protein